MSGGALVSLFGGLQIPPKEKPDKVSPPPPPEKPAYLAIHEALGRKTPHVLEPLLEQKGHQGPIHRRPRNGQACVAKMYLKPKYGSFNEQWAGELRAVRTAQRIVEAWNDAGIIKEQLCVLVPEIMTSSDGGAREQRMIEPLIRGYQKNNNNAGWVNPPPDPWNEVMQALSHFSYHATGGRRLLCDIQGGPVRGCMR
ncbi:kinase-like domain-containing protein [Apiospora hydei]|uniref:Kinase-like domain-containing protein n=1 Tax=Apiospora hydei TaxID=1337664 RepID=A0ABR1WRF8_9PEZI